MKISELINALIGEAVNTQLKIEYIGDYEIEIEITTSQDVLLRKIKNVEVDHTNRSVFIGTEL